MSCSRTAALRVSLAPYLPARCSRRSWPSTGICGFSSNGCQRISGRTSPVSVSSAWRSCRYPTTHQGQTTSDTISTCTVSVWGDASILLPPALRSRLMIEAINRGCEAPLSAPRGPDYLYFSHIILWQRVRRLLQTTGRVEFTRRACGHRAQVLHTPRRHTTCGGMQHEPDESQRRGGDYSPGSQGVADGDGTGPGGAQFF